MVLAELAFPPSVSLASDTGLGMRGECRRETTSSAAESCGGGGGEVNSCGGGDGVELDETMEKRGILPPISRWRRA